MTAMTLDRHLTLASVTWSRHQAVLRFHLGELQFSTVYWYLDVDLDDLTRRFGADLVERLFVHAALFEAGKIASLRPTAIDLGPYARHHSAALEALWREVFARVWAQWRYENDLPDEPPPPWIGVPTRRHHEPVRRDRHDDALLLFCGGGKDSLVAMRLLERAAHPFASFAYASSVYGPARPQLALVDRLLDQGAPIRRHRQLVIDDFFDAPTLELYGPALGVRTIAACETPSSIFAALPLLLARGHGHAVLGHEASANRGNLVWARTGEEVNHQWGKSLAAERLLADYIRAELCADVDVFSLLMPIHDVVIFALLRADEGALAATHSCNLQKPWCRRCPKCAYVWLGCRAHLDREVVDAVFAEDLLEVADNEAHFVGLLGLADRTPFECVGHLEESRLALALCQARGLLGPRGRALAGRLPAIDRGELDRLLDRYLAVDLAGARLPPTIAAGVAPQMRRAAAEAATRIRALLGG